MGDDSVIIQMFHGKKGNVDSIECSKECLDLMSETSKQEDALLDKLKHSSELVELYNKTIDTFTKLHVQELDDFFYEGFKFGVLMGLELKVNKK